MRRTISLTGVLLCVVALGSDSAKEYGDKTTADPFEGTWRRVDDETRVMTCHSGTWIIVCSVGTTLRGTYSIDTTRKPRHFVRFCANGPYKGQTLEDRYDIDSDTLWIADRNDDERPTGFIIGRIYNRVK